ncbi:MAG: fumarate hydratase [Candidatus Omnitrophica bacterium]|nr:fumarate hydratase [Candidatus Omnitrophota bacterium]MBD3268614.1 fumarate hydratase [Candidatus Omnitrophota bacterium]
MKREKKYFKHKDFTLKIEKAVALSHFSLRRDAFRLLERAYRLERKPRAKKALLWILSNARKAKKEKVAICQDTGMPMVFIEIGKNATFDYTLIEAAKEGIKRGYRDNYLRESIVSPLSRERLESEQFIFHLDFSNRRRRTKVTIFPKGFGSENKSALKMFNPTATEGEIDEFIVESARNAGPEACPPFFVGVGIGGTSDKAMLMAKKSLMGRVDRENPDAILRKMESRLYKRINALKIGPMGMGGGFSCLAVKIVKFPTHIAGLPVGVNISCHALRSNSFFID